MENRPIIKFTFWPTVFAVMLLPIFIGLGYWQLDRAKQKKAIQAAYDKRGMAAPLALRGKLFAASELKYRQVVARGRYDTRYQFLLDNRIHNKRAGFHVVTPLKIQGTNTRVLVNRGWIPLVANRNELPAIKTPPGLVIVSGVATVPGRRLVLKKPGKIQKGEWPALWQVMDIDRFRQSVPFPTQPVIVLLNPKSEAGGFTRRWRRLDRMVSIHKGYAATWYTMAFLVVAGYLLMAWRIARQDDVEPNRKRTSEEA